jgi:threonine/homoserine/homoserine lactone efflux protein
LVWLGVHSFMAARQATNVTKGVARRRPGSARGFQQGVTSNLANPKIAVLFTSLLPQFVAHGSTTVAPFLLLGGLFVVMTFVWLSGFALAASRASSALRRPAVKRVLDRLTGVVLIGLGLRLATEHR